MGEVPHSVRDDKLGIVEGDDTSFDLMLPWKSLPAVSQ